MSFLLGHAELPFVREDSTGDLGAIKSGGIFLLTTLDSAVSNWESLGSVYTRHWLFLDGPACHSDL